MPNIYGEKSNTRVQWEKVKNGSLQEKFDWFLQYFGLYALIGVAIVAVLVIWIVIANRPKTPELISGILLDVSFTDENKDALLQEFAKELDADPAKYTVGFSASPFGAADTETQLYQQEVITTRVAAKELDLVGSAESLEGYVDKNSIGSSIFFPLEFMLEEETLRKLAASGRTVSIDTSEGKLAYFIDVAGSRFAELSGISYEHYYLGLVSNAPHPDALEALARLILE